MIKKILWHISEKLGLGDLRRTADDAHHLEVEKYMDAYKGKGATGPKWLGAFEVQRHSQSGEDGVLEEIFKRIGTTNHFFVEFGVSRGLKNNTAALLLAGWQGVWLEGSNSFVESIQKTFKFVIDRGQLYVKNTFVTKDTIEDLFTEANVPSEFDLLSIDIDGNDYWVWQAITHFNPRVFVVEYNAFLGPTLSLTQPYKESWVWDRSNYFGASLKAYELLGKQKGYSLVYCNAVGNNAFFVRNDLVKDKFSSPFTSEHHYQTFKHFLLREHRFKTSFGEFETVA